AFIPKILRDVIERRNRVKEILKKEKSMALQARSYGLKTIANSTYGYLGFFGSRYYCKECAASITSWAREYIQDVIKKAEKEFNVIYSDTDSVAVSLGKKTKKDALNFLSKINRELPSLMELELEEFYPVGIFVSKKGEIQGAKKKYALIDKNGKMKVTGFETVRKDWSLIARETQLKVLEMILEEKDYKNALKYVKKVIKDVQGNKIDIKKMTMTVQLKMKLENYKQIGPHVALAQKLKERGLHVGPGMPIKFVINEGKGKIRDRAKLPNESKNYDIDYYI
ncbi:DNA polymerase, partial [archaeon]|nr:DNA polymerase [archaeon]